jgi:hypothetical protein
MPGAPRPGKTAAFRARRARLAHFLHSSREAVMKRLKLNVEELQVESFASTSPESGMRGTVRAHAKATQETCGCTEGWDTCYTAPESCAHTCIGAGAGGCGYESQSPGWCESQHDSCSCFDACPSYVTYYSPDCN